MALASSCFVRSLSSPQRMTRWLLIIVLSVACAGGAHARSVFGRRGSTRQPRRGPAFGTLEGIRPGKRYPLIDPTTGTMDRRARVIGTGRDRLDQIPVATIQFSSGHQQRYAADRLHLVGQPLGVQRRYLRELKQQVAQALETELGVKADHVPVTTLRGRNTPSQGMTRADLGPFLRAFVGDKPLTTLTGVYQLEGWHDGGRTYLHRPYAGFTRTLRLHETLHALSQPFTRQCQAFSFPQAGSTGVAGAQLARGMERLYEGITDYFAWHTAERRFGIQPDTADPRYPLLMVATRIAQKIGHDQLKQIYLGKGPHLVQRLAQALAPADRAPFAVGGSFQRLATQLQRGDLMGARQTITER